MEEGFYFFIYFDWYNLVFDYNGIVWWYVSQEIFFYNFVRMDNGYFLVMLQGINYCLNMYEFDIMGWVYMVYFFDNEFYYFIFFIENNLVIVFLEYSNGWLDGYLIGKDGVFIINLFIGFEVVYYDMLYVMDYFRLLCFFGSVSGQDVLMDDWLYIN